MSVSIWQKGSDAIVSMNVMVQMPPWVGVTGLGAMFSIGTTALHQCHCSAYVLSLAMPTQGGIYSNCPGTCLHVPEDETALYSFKALPHLTTIVKTQTGNGNINYRIHP
jgi:hypothetical protein